MRPPSESELLSLWEQGLARHPIDRALLLCSWARPELPGERLAGLPLGVVDATVCGCARGCSVPASSSRSVANSAASSWRSAWWSMSCWPTPIKATTVAKSMSALSAFGVPDSRDMANVASELDAEAAALRLLERCCIAHPGTAVPALAAMLGDVEARLEAADPIADLRLAVSCEACGHAWDATLDAGALLWDEVRRHAEARSGRWPRWRGPMAGRNETCWRCRPGGGRRTSACWRPEAPRTRSVGK